MMFYLIKYIGVYASVVKFAFIFSPAGVIVTRFPGVYGDTTSEHAKPDCQET